MMGHPISETPETLRPNNRYLLSRIAELGKNARSLDFGCGHGALVSAARSAGYECFGAETFYEGHRSEDAARALAWGCTPDVLREIRGGQLDFADDFFDIVVHNQVFEHVEHLEQAAAEIRRVLKPGGLMIGIFPTREVIREPHLSLPLVHWFAPGEKRLRWAKAMRRLGFGFSFWGEGDGWYERAFPFLDQRVFFRTRRQTVAILTPLYELEWIEPEWLGYRAPRFRWMLKLPLGRPAARAFAWVAAGVVVEAKSRKVEASSAPTPVARSVFRSARKTA